jgi:hypothetical protein
MSRPGHLVCTACGSGELQHRGPERARCNSCGFSIEDAMFRTLEQIVAYLALWAPTPASAVTPRCVCCPMGCFTARPVARRFLPKPPRISKTRGLALPLREAEGRLLWGPDAVQSITWRKPIRKDSIHDDDVVDHR